MRRRSWVLFSLFILIVNKKTLPIELLFDGGGKMLLKLSSRLRQEGRRKERRAQGRRSHPPFIALMSRMCPGCVLGMSWVCPREFVSSLKTNQTNFRVELSSPQGLYNTHIPTKPCLTKSGFVLLTPPGQQNRPAKNPAKNGSPRGKLND